MRYIIIYDEIAVNSINEYYQSSAVVTNDNYIVATLENALIALSALNVNCAMIHDFLLEN